MTFSCSFETDWNTVYVTPVIAMRYAECEDPACGNTHFQLVLKWAFWSVRFIWSWPS